MKLTALARTDTGPSRSTNEDFCGIFEEDGLVIVCDGMGGHNGGADASRLAVTTIRYMYLFLDQAFHFQITKDLIEEDLEIASRLVGSIRLANRNVYNKSTREAALRGMGTTVSAMAIQDGVAIIAHVGDSRVYRFRQETMKLITQDHTWINELIQDQEIDQEQAKKFEKQNVITRALGLSGSVKIDVGIEPVEAGDLFLICTDGLTKALSDEEIKRIVLFNKGNLDYTLQHLVDTAVMKDGSDNITVALATIVESEPLSIAYHATYLTLKAENKQTIHLEDKILKRELYHRNNSEMPANVFYRRIIKKGSKLLGIAALLIGVSFMAGYALYTHRGKQNSTMIAPVHVHAALTNGGQDSVQRPIFNIKNQIGSEELQQFSKLESESMPDSNADQIIKAAFEKQDYIDLVSKTSSRSLNKGYTDRGKIFLIGLDKFRELENSSLFINNSYYGKTSDCWNKGLLLEPGSYTIVIRDTADKILFFQNNITLSAGDIKPIEIRGK